MYIILVYDINLEENEGKRVLRNAFKTCKNILYIYKIQYLKGEISEAAMLKLEKELKNILEKM